MTLAFDTAGVTAHSEMEGAAGNFKAGISARRVVCYLDKRGEAPAGILRSGNTGVNTAADHLAVPV